MFAVLLPLLLMSVQVNPFQKAYYAALDATSMPLGGRRINWLVPERLSGIWFTRASEHKYAVRGVNAARFSEYNNGRITYYRPEIESEGLCWDAPLPCTTGMDTAVRYRKPGAWNSGGFVRE